MSPIRRFSSAVNSNQATQQSIYTPAYRRVRRRRVTGWLLVVAGGLMAVVHMVTHLGRLQLVWYQDAIMGYPMAAIVILGGFMLVGFATKV